jgi:hypothetical protein
VHTQLTPTSTYFLLFPCNVHTQPFLHLISYYVANVQTHTYIHPCLDTQNKHIAHTEDTHTKYAPSPEGPHVFSQLQFCSLLLLLLVFYGHAFSVLPADVFVRILGRPRVPDVCVCAFSCVNMCELFCSDSASASWSWFVFSSVNIRDHSFRILGRYRDPDLCVFMCKYMRMILFGFCVDTIILIHTYMHTYIHANILTYKHTYMHACMHAYLHKCMHAYIHTYIHAYIHSYLRRFFLE